MVATMRLLTPPPRSLTSSGRKFIHDIEVVRSIVMAYADGEIELEVSPDTKAANKRHAPSFLIGDVVGRDLPRPYTAA